MGRRRDRHEPPLRAVRAIAWHIVLNQALPAPHPRHRHVFAAFCVGLLGNAVLPGTGRRGRPRRRAGASRSEAPQHLGRDLRLGLRAPAVRRDSRRSVSSSTSSSLHGSRAGRCPAVEIMLGVGAALLLAGDRARAAHSDGRASARWTGSGAYGSWCIRPCEGLRRVPFAGPGARGRLLPVSRLDDPVLRRVPRHSRRSRSTSRSRLPRSSCSSSTSRSRSRSGRAASASSRWRSPGALLPYGIALPARLRLRHRPPGDRDVGGRRARPPVPRARGHLVRDAEADPDGSRRRASATRQTADERRRAGRERAAARAADRTAGRGARERRWPAHE